jgi:hypothetical protein
MVELRLKIEEVDGKLKIEMDRPVTVATPREANVAELAVKMLEGAFHLRSVVEKSRPDAN